MIEHSGRCGDLKVIKVLRQPVDMGIRADIMVVAGEEQNGMLAQRGSEECWNVPGRHEIDAMRKKA